MDLPETNNFGFVLMSPGNQYNVADPYSSFRLASELGTDLTMPCIIWTVPHECRALAD